MTTWVHKSVPVQFKSERVNSMAINSAVLPQGDRSGAQRVTTRVVARCAPLRSPCGNTAELIAIELTRSDLN